MRVIFDFLHVRISQSTGEFVFVDVFVLWDVFVGAVLPRAARGPPEKALLLVRAATGKTISHVKTSLGGLNALKHHFT